MPKRYTAHEIASTLSKTGIVHARTSGESIHAGFFRGANRTVVIPRSKGPIPAGTFSSILRQANLTRQEFDDLYRDHTSKEIWNNRPDRDRMDISSGTFA